MEFFKRAEKEKKIFSISSNQIMNFSQAEGMFSDNVNVDLFSTNVVRNNLKTKQLKAISLMETSKALT